MSVTDQLKHPRDFALQVKRIRLQSIFSARKHRGACRSNEQIRQEIETHCAEMLGYNSLKELESLNECKQQALYTIITSAISTISTTSISLTNCFLR